MIRFVLVLTIGLIASACQAGERLDIKREGTVLTTVEIQIAETAEQRRTGLMRVKYMPADQGMLFLFPEARLISMWMRETYISLDMIFAQCDGTISHIHENAIPHDETIISSVGLASVVLEVNGGFVKQWGVRAGDKLDHSRLAGEGCAP